MRRRGVHPRSAVRRVGSLVLLAGVCVPAAGSGPASADRAGVPHTGPVRSLSSVGRTRGSRGCAPRYGRLPVPPSLRWPVHGSPARGNEAPMMIAASGSAIDVRAHGAFECTVTVTATTPCPPLGRIRPSRAATGVCATTAAGRQPAPPWGRSSDGTPMAAPHRCIPHPVSVRNRVVIDLPIRGLWRSLVARLTGGQEVVGSNPASPTAAGSSTHGRLSRLLMGDAVR